jgi:hypothetical protein
MIQVTHPLEIAPLFKADSVTFSFYPTKDGKISVNYQGWDQSKTVLVSVSPRGNQTREATRRNCTAFQSR